ncbi:MAG TPA: hypothetical protein VGR45_16605 [Stellaceae bacterium]|nr:hypothetical protein [Stellaceae bacterium]
MFGSIFAGPSYAGLGEGVEIATPASTPRRTSGEWKDGLAAIVHLGCVAAVAGLTICVFFGLAFHLLSRPTDEATAASGARDRESGALTRWVLTGSESAGSAPSLQATGPDTAGQQVQLAVATSAGPTEPRDLQIHQNPGPRPIENASADIVSGPVTAARDAMTWVVGGQILHLWGIRPDLRPQSAALAGFAAKVSTEGPIICRRQAHSTRYRCLTATRDDIAEMALLSGIGRVAAGATIAYRDAEAQAREKGSGLRLRP